MFQQSGSNVAENKAAGKGSNTRGLYVRAFRARWQTEPKGVFYL